MTHHTVLIVGGGAAGVSVANNMRRQNANIDIAINSIIITPIKTYFSNCTNEFRIEIISLKDEKFNLIGQINSYKSDLKELEKELSLVREENNRLRTYSKI